ncbi:uncharacterized protein N7483_011833 [Penicillium malachiteum]|uniref:uncharacterized protein n=1 Tax=Penicillium malachiteum TaxID=1324776 RepID=UPI002548FB8A|nr:uncharacterized protein N7483_011833 [Penicillium malachiteum]KAJ5714652.1 hypothetical protein N7483_011833 [Penicillium malachiteum]
MHFSTLLAASSAILPALAAPARQVSLKDAASAVPGESSLFTTYPGRHTPLASNWTRVIPATGTGEAGSDDLLFQNLLSAEWVIYSFYQKAVETFKPEDFTKLGYKNTTYERIVNIRDNEAGHIRIFQDQISDNSLKPGPCSYDYGFNTSAAEFLELQVYIEVSSQAFLTGLQLEATKDKSKSALMAIGQTETRHNVWSLIENYRVSPFAGPADTTYPYANQVLELTRSFILECPSANPVYPSPRQALPQIAIWGNGTTATPGSVIQPLFYQPENQPEFLSNTTYYAVFYHGVNTVSVEYDYNVNEVTIPKDFDINSGIIIMNIAKEKDAPTAESVVAGPLILLQQPHVLTLETPDVVTL